MKKNGLLVVTCSALLTGCSGGGSTGSNTGPDDAPTLSPGLYSATLHGSEFGEILQGTDHFAIYSTRARTAYGTWAYSSGSASISMTFLSHPVDDLGNEFPSAKSSNRTEDFRVTQSGANWSGPGLTLTPSTLASAPAISSIPRNWRFRNLYRFGSEFLDYAMQIDIDSVGTLSGFDTNGCNFTGSLSEMGSGLYRVLLHASLCGATNRYIENYSYSGYGHLRQSESPPRLSIDVVNSAAATGISVDLFSQ